MILVIGGLLFPVFTECPSA